MPDYGDGSPRENYGAVDPLAPSVANGQITPDQWAEYQRQRRRAAILGTLGTLGGMLGGGALNYAMGGGAASSASVPGAVGASSPPLGMGTVTAPIGAGLGGGMGAGAGSSIGAATAAGGAAGGSKALGGIFGSMTARDLASLGLAGVATVGGAMSNNNVPPPTSATTDPNMQRLIATMQGRLDQSEPLYKSIMAMANGLLPTQYQNGGAGR